MKGIILAAGTGTRLLPLTRDIPKCLVEVDGQTILDSQLAALSGASIDEAIVVTGYRNSQIDAHVAGHPPPLRVTTIFNPFWAVSSSIGSVWAARAALTEPFCLMNGDTVFTAPVITAAVADGDSDIGLLVEPIAAPEFDDMRVAVDAGRVRAVSKGLPVGQATHRSLGVIVSAEGGCDYLDALSAVIAAPDGIGAYHHDVIDRLARTTAVRAIVDRDGGWQEIDRPEDIAAWTRVRHRPPAP